MCLCQSSPIPTLFFSVSLRCIFPNSSSPKVKSNHPWMTLVHPGPWTQLPPAPPPVPASRARSAFDPQGSSNRPKVPAPPNPFEEEEVEGSHGEGPEPESSETAVQSENSEDTDMVVSIETEDPVTSSEQAGGRASDGLTEGGPAPIGAQKQHLPRSLSVPALPSNHHQTNRQVESAAAGEKLNYLLDFILDFIEVYSWFVLMRGSNIL